MAERHIRLKFRPGGGEYMDAHGEECPADPDKNDLTIPGMDANGDHVVIHLPLVTLQRQPVKPPEKG